MQAIGEDVRSFSMSLDELRRRQKAFDRLGLSAILAFAVSAADLLAPHSAAVLAVLACLAALFIASRAWLDAGTRRYAQTVWDMGDTSLTRTDSHARVEYRLHSIRQIQAKRTTAGAIREIKLSFNDGPAVYVNGLEDAESFWGCLNSRNPGASQAVLHEPIDYDHPVFYVALGCVVGASVGLIVRIGVSTPQFSEHWIYVALAVYSFGLGVYWLRAKPISGRYGIHAVAWDYGVAAVSFLCLAGSAIAAAVW